MKNNRSIHYPILGKPGCLDCESLTIQEDDFFKLNNNIERFLRDKKFPEAVNYAAKAALLYGVPGLILYLKASLAKQQSDKKQNNFSQQKAFDNLTLALLTQKLLVNDPQALQMVTEYLPSEPINDENYLQDIINNFINLQTRQMTNYLDECKQLSDQFLELCLDHRISNRP